LRNQLVRAKNWGDPGQFQARIFSTLPGGIGYVHYQTRQKTVSQTSPIRPRIANPAIPFSGSTGNCVHAHGKYCYLRLFFKTGQKEGHFNLQNSGPVRAACFRMGWNTWGRERMALWALRLAGSEEALR
jgi:hypothetical protein